VTINRSGSAYRSAGITQAGYLYPGATNTFTASATDFLNFGAADSFTVVFIHRQWNNAVDASLIGNRVIVSGTITPGYFMSTATQSGGVNRTVFTVSDSSASIPLGASAAEVGWINGELNTHIGILNRSTNISSFVKNSGTALTTSTSTATGSLSNVNPFRIGANSPTIANYATMELIGAAVFRTVLTATQIRQITNYFANREGLL
jgi:hypothetical protein